MTASASTVAGPRREEDLLRHRCWRPFKNHDGQRGGPCLLFRRWIEAMILRQLDAERQTVADSDATLEKTPHVVRAFGVGGSWSGIVYSRFSPSETEAIVNAEIEYFTRLERDFEWKVYSHDEPPDLLGALARLRLQDRRRRIVDDLRSKGIVPSDNGHRPAGVTVSPVRDEERMEDYLSVESAVWSCEPDKTRELLPRRSAIRSRVILGSSPTAIGNRSDVDESQSRRTANSQGSGAAASCRIFAGEVSIGRSYPPGSIISASSIRFVICAWMRCPRSRPILEKYGFRRIASTWPADWPPDAISSFSDPCLSSRTSCNCCNNLTRGHSGAQIVFTRICALPSTRVCNSFFER